MRDPRALLCVIARCLASCLLVSVPAQAYSGMPFDAKDLLDLADVVCHAKVLSVRPHEVEKDARFNRPVTEGGIARVRVLNAIKGAPSATVDVVFRRSTPFVPYTTLLEDDECILFLHRRDGHYRFVDDLTGKLRIPPHKAIQYRSKSHEDRMLAELVHATKADSGLIRLECAEQLGNFAHAESIARLKELVAVKDMAVQGVAYAALIRLDRPPAARELAVFFSRTDDTRSLQRFRTTGYSNGHLKGMILNELNSRFNVICRDLNPAYIRHSGREYVAARAGAERWKSFDLIGFLNSAPWQDRDTSSVADNRVIARIVGNQIDTEARPAFMGKTYRNGSGEIVAELLQSDERGIRLDAARAIDKIIAEPHDFPYPQSHVTTDKGWTLRSREEFAKDVDAYVAACRDWLAGHVEWARNGR